MAFFDFAYNTDTNKITFGNASPHVLITHLYSAKGSNKFYPLIGVNIQRLRDGNNSNSNIGRAISQSLQADGLTGNQLTTSINQSASMVSIKIEQNANS